MNVHDWSLWKWLQVDLSFNNMWGWCHVIKSHIKHLRKRHTNYLCNYKRWGNSVLKNSTLSAYKIWDVLPVNKWDNVSILQFVSQYVNFNSEQLRFYKWERQSICALVGINCVCSVIDICVMTPHSSRYTKYGEYTCQPDSCFSLPSPGFFRGSQFSCISPHFWQIFTPSFLFVIYTIDV